MWTDEPTNSLVPPGVQLIAEGEANDDELTDWLHVIPDHLEGYAFAAVTRDSEALEPRSLAEAKRGGDWPLWKKAIHEELATLKAAGTWDLDLMSRLHHGITYSNTLPQTDTRSITKKYKSPDTSHPCDTRQQPRSTNTTQIVRNHHQGVEQGDQRRPR
jgi:hypothetical protein